jgi:multiple sugar transport system permease protein
MRFVLPEEKIWRTVGYIYLVGMLLVLTFPFFVALLTSLKTPAEVYTTPPTWLPQFPRPQNYIDMFQALPLGRAFLNSLIIAVGSAGLTLLAALPAGYSLSRFEFPGRRAFLYFVLGSIMFSPVVIIVALYRLISMYGLLNKYPSLILTDATFSLPFCIWLATAYMRSIPRELDEAASIDGASRLQSMWHVVMPLALPGLVTVGVFAFIQAWNEFLLANTFMDTTAMKPLSVTLYDFVGYRGIEWQYLTGAVLLATIPAILLFLIVQRWIISGLTAGAVK